MIDIPACAPKSRNAAATRAAILEAAGQRFSREGYDSVSVREIAGDAGVDAALVLRYFGSKDGLFSEVLSQGGSIDELIEGDRAEFGSRVAKTLLVDPFGGEKLQKMLVILRSASSPKAAPAIRANTQENFFGPLEDWLGGDEAKIRARLLASLLMGFCIDRAIDRDDMTEAEMSRLVDRLSGLLQGIVDGECA